MEQRLPADDQAFEDEWLDIEGTDLLRRKKPWLVNFLSEAGDCPRWQVEDNNLVGLRVTDIAVLLGFRIDKVFDADAVLTISERSALTLFFFELEFYGFMVDDVQVGTFVKADGSIVE